MLTLTHSIWASPPMFKGLINKSFDVKVTGPLQDEEAIRGGLISASSSLSMYKAMGFFDRSQREREREARFEALKERHSIYNLPDSSAMQGMVKRVNLRKKQGRSAGGPQELPVYITVLRDMRRPGLKVPLPALPQRPATGGGAPPRLAGKPSPFSLGRGVGKGGTRQRGPSC